jgi:hypothetical protein
LRPKAPVYEIGVPAALFKAAVQLGLGQRLAIIHSFTDSENMLQAVYLPVLP